MEVSIIMSNEYPLNVPAPHHFTFAVRDIPDVTVEQRERVLKATHYNEFAFPAGMLTVDMLSDSGTTAMTNHQWASLFLGDEAYGRNTGYYVLLDTFRDIFERGGEKNWKKILDLVRTDCRDVETMMEKVYLPEYEGGLFNGGAAQMERPNTFIIQQGRAAESVLMEIVKKILAARHPGREVNCVGLRAHYLRGADRLGENVFRYQVDATIEDTFSFILMIRPADRPQAVPIRWELSKADYAALPPGQLAYIPPEALLPLWG